VEEGSAGGFGAYVLHYVSDEGLTDDGLKIRTMRLPDTFIDQDKPDKMYDEAELNAKHIIATALKALGHNDVESIHSSETA
jgi:1-deoxy-D-xylulose-5-phosphate synthase